MNNHWDINKKISFNLQAISIIPLMNAVRILILSYSALYFLFGAILPCIFLLASLFIFDTATRYLISKKKYFFSRVIFVFSCNFYIFAASLLLNHQVNNEIYYGPAMLLGILLFRTHETKQMLTMLLIPLFFATLNVLGPSLDLNSPSIDLQKIAILKSLNFFVALIISGLFIRFYILKNNKIYQENINELEKFKNELQSSKKIVDALNIGVWKYYPKSQHLVWDKSMFRLFGVNEADFSSHYVAWENCLTPESKAVAIRELNLALSGEKTFDTVFEINSINENKRKFIGGKAFVIRDENGVALEMNGINWDRTNEILLEKKLRTEQARAIQNAKMVSLGEISAGIAHEINNPLAIINTTAAQAGELLDETPFEKTQIKTMLNTIFKTSNRIAKIVQGLRTFSRDGSRDSFESVFVKDLLEEIEVICLSRFKMNHVQFVLAPIDKSLFFEGRATQISEVLVNLLNNSFDAIQSLKEKWINVSAHKNGDFVEIEITDSGPGIPQELQKKIFQPFFTTKDAGRGTGMGLSISQGIIEVHQGEISIDNDCANTRFIVRLPIRQAVNHSMPA